MANVGPDLPSEIRAAVRKEAITTVSKWAIAFFVMMLGFAATGWWLFLKPRLIEIVGGVPVGAIIAFDRAPPRPCPEGWIAFKEATSRVIVGAGNSSDSYEARFSEDENGKPLTPRAYRQHGGEEKHLLTVEEMPSHSHSYATEIGADGNRSGQQDATYGRTSSFTSSAGGDVPHNNMPPYVALYYCIKQ